MDISVIIINYNTSQIIKKCIDALLLQENIDYEIIVLDNNSPDDSVAALKTYGDKIKLIASHENFGFGKGCNQAFKQAKGEYIYLLNPDAYVQTKNDLANLVKFMRENPKFGLAGTRIVKADGTGEPVIPGSYPGERHLKTPLPKLPGNIAWFIGASMVIKSKAYADINGFDEDFFLYGEDADICLRIRKAGYEIGFIEAVTVRHIGTSSESKTPTYDFRVKRQKGLYLFYLKNYTKADAKYIIKKTLRRALFHYYIYNVKKLFADTEHIQKRFNRYKAMVTTSREYLAKL